MSWRANVDIVIALNALRIVSFRKQGRLRFRLSLLHAPRNPDPKVTSRPCRYPLAIARLTTSTSSTHVVTKLADT